MMNIQCRFLMDLVIIIYIHPILPQQFIQVHLSHYSRLAQVQIDLHSSYPAPVVQQVHLSHYSRLGQDQIDLHSSYPAPVVHTGISCSLDRYKIIITHFSLHENPLFLQSEYGSDLCMQYAPEAQFRGIFFTFISMREYPNQMTKIKKLLKSINYRAREKTYPTYDKSCKCDLIKIAVITQFEIITQDCVSRI